MSLHPDPPRARSQTEEREKSKEGVLLLRYVRGQGLFFSVLASVFWRLTVTSSMGVFIQMEPFTPGF